MSKTEKNRNGLQGLHDKKCERHLYEYDVKRGSKSAPDFVVELAGSAKKILEIGCGPGSITRILAQEPGREITGLDRDREAILKATPYCDRIFEADLDGEAWVDLISDQSPFDAVIAADVLEHLYNPWATLERMKELVGEKGYLVVSLPHAGHAAVIACLLSGKFDYHDYGLLDRTHIRFFCLEDIRNLFQGAGLKIIDVRFVIKAGADTELAERWARIDRAQQKAIVKSPHTYVYQVVVKAVRVDQPAREIDLLDELARVSKDEIARVSTIPARFRSFGRRVARNLLRRLSPRF